MKIHILKLQMQQLLRPTWGPRQSAYKLMYLLTKPVLKNKFIKMLRIFYIEIDLYFVMYLYKCKLNCLKKRYQEKWENAYLTAKSETASGALSGPHTPGLWSVVSAN